MKKIIGILVAVLFLSQTAFAVVVHRDGNDFSEELTQLKLKDFSDGSKTMDLRDVAKDRITEQLRVALQEYNKMLGNLTELASTMDFMDPKPSAKAVKEFEAAATAVESVHKQLGIAYRATLSKSGFNYKPLSVLMKKEAVTGVNELQNTVQKEEGDPLEISLLNDDFSLSDKPTSSTPVKDPRKAPRRQPTSGTVTAQDDQAFAALAAANKPNSGDEGDSGLDEWHHLNTAASLPTEDTDSEDEPHDR
jgi:hypothetical protein